MALRGGPSDLLLLEGLHCCSLRSSDCNQCSVSTFKFLKCHSSHLLGQFYQQTLSYQTNSYIRASCVQVIGLPAAQSSSNRKYHSYQDAFQKQPAAQCIGEGTTELNYKKAC